MNQSFSEDQQSRDLWAKQSKQCRGIVRNSSTHRKMGFLAFVMTMMLLTVHPVASSAQDNSCRRHIVVAIDGSGSFLNHNPDCRTQIVSYLSSLFQNKQDSRFGRQLSAEHQQGHKFYDPEKDVVSFYQFYISSSKWSSLNGKYRSLSKSSLGNTVINDVSDALIHPVDSLSLCGRGDVVSALERFVNCGCSDYSRVTLSQFVFPLIMKKLVFDYSAEEYILVFISDFQSGSSAGSSNNDWNVLRRDVLGSNDAALASFKKELELLKYYFYRIDYADYAPVRHDGMPACYIYRVKPNVGIGGAENAALYMESDLGMVESRHNTFRTKKQLLRFVHSDIVRVKGVAIDINDENKNPVFSVYYDASESNSGDININNEYISIPSLTFSNEKISDLKSDSVNYSIVFKVLTSMTGDSLPTVPFAFAVSRGFSSGDISFINTDKRHHAMVISVIVLCLALLVLMALLGSRKKLDVTVGRFAQKYVDVSKDEGSLELPCWFYEPGQNTKSIQVKYEVTRPLPISFPGRTKVFARLQDGKPTGFNYFVNGKDASDFVPLDNSKGSFVIQMDVNPQNVDVNKLQKCGVCLDFWVVCRQCGIKTFEKAFSLPPVRFFFTHDLGYAWAGFDPGTTGSSVAIGSTGGTLASPNITLVKESLSASVIIPSRLAFDKPISNTLPLSDLKPGIDYKYGTYVEQNLEAINRARVPNFQSIKKLLGYKNSENDKIVVVTGKEQSKVMKVTGLEMAHLLVKGLNKEMNEYVSRMPVSDRQRYTGSVGMPRRAVVAIPNNYTLPKTLDMVNSIRMLDNFKEVRYIYEAEGILFNYFSRNISSTKPGVENIMVFDMGGATINVSVFQVRYEETGGSIYYNVKTLGRLGYAVGGDNIDVALMEYVFTNQLSGKHTDSERHQYQLGKRTAILKNIFELKKNLVAVYGTQTTNTFNFSSPDVLRDFINELLEGYDSLSENAYSGGGGSVNYAQFESGRMVNSKILKQFVYDNIRDAVSEILQFPDIKMVKKIDQVIFSGRSTLFPKVRSTVQDVLKENKCLFSIYNGLKDTEIKTAVAHGACWYGIYNSLVTLDNSNLTSAYGYKKTSGSTSHLNILLNHNDRFNSDGTITNTKQEVNNFDSDGNVVDFFQVMGGGLGDDIFEENNRHKINFIGSIPVSTLTESVSMSVNRHSKVSCEVTFSTGDKSTINEINVSGRDIAKENEWAYVFATNQ